MMLTERWAIAFLLAASVASAAGAPRLIQQEAQQDAQQEPQQDTQQTQPPEDAQPAAQPAPPPAPPADPAQQQLEKDSAELLQLVQELKVEVDKAGSDTLSLAALRKADAVQKLAKNLKDRMKERVQVTVK
jgi:hypothetical protein